MTNQTHSRLSSGFGHWTKDDSRLPVYEYSSESRAPYFFLGNHRLTLFCGVDGTLQIVTGERSWMRMNHGRGFSGAHEARLDVGGTAFALVGADAEGFRKRAFGCGEILMESECGGVVCRRILAVQPDTMVADAPPAFTLRVEWENRSGEPQTIRYTERLRANPRMLCHQWKESAPGLSFGVRCEGTGGAGLRAEFSAELDDPHLAPERGRPAMVDAFPPDLLVLAEGAEVRMEGEGWIGIRAEAELPAGASGGCTWGCTLEFPRDGEKAAGRLAELIACPRADFREAWRQRIPELSDEPDAALRSELAWHAHALEAMATYDEWDGEVFIPQGSNYDYSHFSGAPRDHLQHALGAMVFHPELAASVLRRVLGQMNERGEVAYMRTGAGLSTNAMWHTSDQQLYLFHTLLEYLRITGDYAFLGEEVRIHPPEAGWRRTVFEAIEAAFAYLRDEVGTGHHGLPRLLNSDWNDGMFYGRPLRYPDFLTASSHANAAMAAALVEPLADELERGRAHIRSQRLNLLLASMRAYGSRITGALLADLDGRTFARRAYLGDGSPLGDDVMFLEPQPWLLMAPAFDRKSALWEEIRHRLCDGEPLGSRCIERTVDGHAGSPQGQGENGGFWYALHGQLVAALAPLDPSTARDLLERMSLRHFAREYPDVWYGHWSGSDTANSSLANEPGPMPSSDPSRELTPNPCAHPHAYALYCYSKIRAAENARGRDRANPSSSQIDSSRSASETTVDALETLEYASA